MGFLAFFKNVCGFVGLAENVGVKPIKCGSMDSLPINHVKQFEKKRMNKSKSLESSKKNKWTNHFFIFLFCLYLI